MQKTKSQLNPNKIRRKTFLIQKFINFLIIIRLYLTQIPLWLWATCLVLLYALKIIRQGNIPSSIFVIIAMLLSVSGEYFKIDFIFLMAPIFAGISHFFSYKIFWLPKVPGPVGLRQQVIENDLYLLELFPIKKNQNVKKKVVNWNYRLQMNKMMEHDGARNPIYRAIFKFFISAVSKTKIIFAQGDEQVTNQTIVYSHGRTGTPLMSSQLLLKLTTLQNSKFNIMCVQHTQKRETGQIQAAKIKKYRQIQIQARSAQMFSSIQLCKDKKRIILMGHSYGGGTTIQTYHNLPEQVKQKVSHLILLDPWFFPLTDSRLIQQVKCPVLILANEYFLQNEDIYKRNKQFVNANRSNNVIYLVWKQGDHLHQTDLGFIIGTIFNKMKHPELSVEMLNKNVEAIRVFVQNPMINEKKMRQIFEADLLPAEFKPQKWNNALSL